MTLNPHEFIRRFLIHVLPKGFHRIRHYGLLANGNRDRDHRGRARQLLNVAPPAAGTASSRRIAPRTTDLCCPIRARAAAAA